MGVISIFSGSFCSGDEVARGVARRLGYEFVSEELLDDASNSSGLSPERLARAMEGPPPFFNRMTHEREKAIAHLALAMADLVKRDGTVYQGFAGHLIPRGIAHVLQVCVIANFDHRVALAVERDGVPEREAAARIHAEDGRRGRWTRWRHQRDPYDPEMYDVVLPMHSMTPAEAMERICELAGREEVRTTPASLAAADDFIVASRVQVALVSQEPSVEVSCVGGAVTVSLNRYVTRLAPVRARLKAAAGQVPGVKSVRCVPGTRFVPPSLVIPAHDLAPPSKILLVDDEREFVHTLSERLQARDLEPAVVYDGEQALAFVAEDEPEVMVLDLKMPGIDGIEVLRKVKRDHPAVEVIILTGHGSEREEELARELGAFAYLRKPVNIDLLTKAMREAYSKIRGARSREGSDGEE